MADDPVTMQEADWLRHRIAQLDELRRFTSDDRAAKVIGDMIAEARARLERLTAPSN